MKLRTRIALLTISAPAAGLIAATLLLFPLSLDVTGDLRELVSFGDDGNLTFAGVGVGTPSPDPALLGTIPKLERLRGDFGTDLIVMGSTKDGLVSSWGLGYSGNPLAVARLAMRWREVFVSRGATCGLRFCEFGVESPGRVRRLTFLRFYYGWYGLESVVVDVTD